MGMRVGRSVRVALAAMLGALAGGCAMGTTDLTVRHRPLDPIANKRQGNILVRKFADSREPASERGCIGVKRNGFGMPLGRMAASGTTPLPDLLTAYFAEALTQAGYNATIEGSPSAAEPAARYDAVVEGEIVKFWEDLYLMIWHEVDVSLRARKTTGGTVVWRGRAAGSSRYLLWLGISSELERPIASALTQALNEAARQFASDDFYQHVKQ